MSTPESHAALRETAEAVLRPRGLELDEIAVRPGSGAPTVRVVVDLPADQLGQVDLDTLSEVSTALNDAADADDALLGPQPTVLEVTTPGVERPLTEPRHFRRARGRLVLARTTGGEELRARVLAVSDDDVLTLRREPGKDARGRPRKLPTGVSEHVELPVADVETATVQVEFSPPPDLERLLADAAPHAPKES